MLEVFDICNYNILKDSENYYFLRALNMADNDDLEKNIIAKNGKIYRIRTDLQRAIEKNLPNIKYNENSKISLEEMIDHIKIHYRRDTNCISLSPDANISIRYGRTYYKDKYVLIKINKNEIDKKVFDAGKFILDKILEKMNIFIESSKDKEKILDEFSKIEKLDNKELEKLIIQEFKFKGHLKLHKRKSKLLRIVRPPVVKLANYETLNEKQNLEKNRIITKMIILDKKYKMPNILKNMDNMKIIDTIGRAFLSVEFIHYGEIGKDEILSIDSKEVDEIAKMQKK